MGQYSIKEIESLSGVKAHTLRIWEQRYDFLKPKRTDTNIRYYTDEQMRLLLNIGTLNRHGMKISKIAELDEQQLGKQVLEIYSNTHQPDDLLDALVMAMIDFDERRFERTLSHAINKLGIENAFTELAFPFMMRTGVLWTTGAVNVAQEHFVTNLLRRKIIVAIDGLLNEPIANAKKFVLFLPENEVHDLLLLYTEYLLRKMGHHVLYLGSSMPVNDLRDVLKNHRPDFLLSYLTVPFTDFSLQDYVKQLLKDFPSVNLILGGSQVHDIKTPPVSNCHFIYSAQDLSRVIGG